MPLTVALHFPMASSLCPICLLPLMQWLNVVVALPPLCNQNGYPLTADSEPQPQLLWVAFSAAINWSVVGTRVHFIHPLVLLATFLLPRFLNTLLIGPTTKIDHFGSIRRRVPFPYCPTHAQKTPTCG